MSLTHGNTMYRRGCRCEVCRAAWSERNKTYKDQERKRKRSRRDVTWTTPDELRVILGEGFCPFCGWGPFDAVANHLRFCDSPLAEDAGRVKEMAELGRCIGLISPELSERRAASAIRSGVVPGDAGASRGGPGVTLRTQSIETIMAGRRKAGPVSVIVADAPHGTFNGYNHHGCRCAQCRASNSSRQAAQHAVRIANGLPPNALHGASTYVNWGCRCEVCSAAHKSNLARQRDRRRRWAEPATSTNAGLYHAVTKESTR